jgi:hypothetical protein
MANDRAHGRFPTTRWSRVAAAADPDRSDARTALAELCAAYWFPVYALIRRKGHDPEHALDLAQDVAVHRVCAVLNSIAGAHGSIGQWNCTGLPTHVSSTFI